MSNSDPTILAYEHSPPAGAPPEGVTVADSGDRLVITGPRPRPLKATHVVFWALAWATYLAWMIYTMCNRRRGWQFGPEVVVFTLLSTGFLLAQFALAWHNRRPRVTEVTPHGVAVTDHLSLSGWVRYPRHRIECMHLVHDDVPRDDGTRACTLRLILKRDRGALPPLFGKDAGIVILTGPATHLREIGDRIREVLDYAP